MIYTGHLPASGDSFYVSVARSCNDPLSLCLPEPGRLSFREICRPRPQPIRSSAAPVKFTRQVYMAVSCVTRRGLLLVSRRVGGKNSAVARSRVSRCLGATTKKRQKEDVRDERAEPQRGEREPKGRLEPDTRKFVKEPFYISTPRFFGHKWKQDGRVDPLKFSRSFPEPSFQNPRTRAPAREQLLEQINQHPRISFSRG